MTEYDYSPAAYQRYMETQNRIARWVDNTEAHHNAFRAPFGSRSDIGEEDMDGMSEADEALPSGASAGGWYEEKRRTGERNTTVPPPPPPLFYHPQPTAPAPTYPALASAPMGYNYPTQAAYMSPPASPPQPQIIIQSVPKHRSHRHHHRSSKHSSSSESRTRTYTLPPPGTAAPPMQIPSSSYGYPGYPGAQPPPGTYTYPPSALPYTSGSPYPTQAYSPMASPPPMMVPSPSPYYPQPGTSYVIVPKKGKQIRVTYV